MKSNHRNLWRTIFLLYIILSSIGLVVLTRRLDKAEQILKDRTPLVQTILDTQIQTIKNTKDIELLYQHHLRLLGGP